MDGLRKTTIRLLMLAAFGGFVFWYAHLFAEYIIVSRYSDRIAQDLVKLAVMVENENVLSTDSLGGKSPYADFVDNVLRVSEDATLKYDVQAKGPAGIQQNESLNTTGYRGANQSNNPIKIYYKDSLGNNIHISSYTDCPNRGTLVYVELTGNIYVPVLTTLRRTSDEFSLKYYRRLEKVTKTTTVLCSNFYKGK